MAKAQQTKTTHHMAKFSSVYPIGAHIFPLGFVDNQNWNIIVQIHEFFGYRV